MMILVIGGTGNISSEVVTALLARGHRVTVMNRGNRPAPEGCAQLIADRSDRKAFAAALEGRSFDAAIDFRCFTREDGESAYEALKGKTAQFVFISSAVVYRKPHTALPITEDTPQGNPFSEYARNKIACEEYLRGVHGRDFPVTIIRPSHTFGRQWIPSPLHGNDFTVSARIRVGRPIIVHDNGQSLWTMTACSDFARGLAGLVGNERAIGEAFHITSDQPLTWNSIYFELGLALGRQPEIVHVPSEFLAKHHPRAEATLIGDKKEHGVFDNLKIKRFVPEFECRKSFRTAIRESVAWFDEDPSRKAINPQQDRSIDDLTDKWKRHAG